MKQLTHYRQEGVGVGLELVLKSVLCFEDFRRISPECADSEVQHRYIILMCIKYQYISVGGQCRERS